MPEKVSPFGVCDFCGGRIQDPWTTRGTPRLHCSTVCKATANSRIGAPIRSRKARERIARGQWQNPAKLNPPTPEEQARSARLSRQREVEAGTWRNPALTDEAREKLSRPRKHGDNPILHSAIEKLTRGESMAELTQEEAETYRAYRRQLADARRDEINAKARERYRKQQEQLTPEEREAQREKWRQENRRRAAKKKSSRT